MEKEGTCRAPSPHVSWQGANLVSSLILQPPNPQLYSSAMSISKYFVCLSAGCKLYGADSVKGSWELFWQALAGRRKLAALFHTLCHALSGEAKAEAGFGENMLASSLCTAGHQGQRAEGKKKNKKKKDGKKDRSGLPNWRRLPSLLDLSHGRLSLPFLSLFSSPPVTCPVSWLSAFTLFSRMNEWTPAKRSHRPLSANTYMLEMYTLLEGRLALTCTQ